MELNEIWHTYRTNDALSNDTKASQSDVDFKVKLRSINDLEIDFESNVRLQ